MFKTIEKEAREGVKRKQKEETLLEVERDIETEYREGMEDEDEDFQDDVVTFSMLDMLQTYMKEEIEIKIKEEMQQLSDKLDILLSEKKPKDKDTLKGKEIQKMFKKKADDENSDNEKKSNNSVASTSNSILLKRLQDSISYYDGKRSMQKSMEFI